MKLRISLKRYLKRLIVGGLEHVYEIGRVFRNEGVELDFGKPFEVLSMVDSVKKYTGIDSCGMLLSAINKRGEEEELNLLMYEVYNYFLYGRSICISALCMNKDGKYKKNQL